MAYLSDHGKKENCEGEENILHAKFNTMNEI